MKNIRDIRQEGVKPSLNPFKRKEEVSMALAGLTLDHHPLIISVDPDDDLELSLTAETPRIGVSTTMGVLGKKALTQATEQIEQLILIREKGDKDGEDI